MSLEGCLEDVNANRREDHIPRKGGADANGSSHLRKLGELPRTAVVENLGASEEHGMK